MRIYWNQGQECKDARNFRRRLPHKVLAPAGRRPPCRDTKPARGPTPTADRRYRSHQLWKSLWPVCALRGLNTARRSRAVFCPSSAVGADMARPRLLLGLAIIVLPGTLGRSAVNIRSKKAFNRLGEEVTGISFTIKTTAPRRTSISRASRGSTTWAAKVLIYWSRITLS